MNKETVPLSLKGLLLFKVTLPRLGDVAFPPNTQKQIHEGSQNEEKNVSNKRTGQNSRKRTKGNGDSSLPDTQFKTLVIRLFLMNLGGINELRTSTKG